MIRAYTVAKHYCTSNNEWYNLEFENNKNQILKNTINIES